MMNTTYTSSKFVTLKGACPVCNGERKDCRSSGDLIHCYSHNEPPHGYEFKGLTAIGASLYAPAKNSTDSRSQSYTQRRFKQDHPAKLNTIKTEVEGDPKLPSLEERDRKVKRYPNSITKSQGNDLLRRGLTESEIRFAISNRLLFGLQGGYGISAYDPVSGLLCGAQRANDDRSKAKYTWGVFKGVNKLQETGKNPLFTWVSPDFDSSKPYQIKYCEGALKSLIRAFQEWRSNPQIIVIGAAGGIFGAKSLERVLGAFPDATSHTLLCDSDTQNHKKLNIDRAYRNLADAIPSVKFANWEQWQDKSKLDCDETYGTNAFNGYLELEPSEFLKFFDKLRKEKEKAKLFEFWQKNKAFTPDIRLNSQAVLDGIPIPDVNSIIVIKSDFGTQKTRGMKPHLSYWQSQGYGVILGGYRNALLAQTVSEWSKVLRNFTMMKADPMVIYRVKSNLAACLDQFTRKKCKPENFDKRILVLDEADAVEIHLLMSGTLRDNRSEVYSLFCEAVKRAEVIYLMSAALTDATVQFITDIRGDRDTQVIKYQNDFVHKQKFVIVNDAPKLGRDGKVTEISNRSILRTMLLTFKSKCCVVADSQNDLKALELESKKRGKITFRYDSETSDSESGKEFAANPDKFIKDNNIEHLFISPSGNSGISITIENYFDAVFAFYFGVIDVDSFLQMPMRIRDRRVTRYISCPNALEFFGDAVPKKFPEQIESAISDFMNDFGVLSAQNLPVQDSLEKLYKALSDVALNDLQFKRFAQIQASHNFEKANLKECLERRLSDLGHNFTYLDDGNSNNNLIEQLLETKEEVKLDECKKIYESPDISIVEAKALQDRDCSYEDRLKVEKAFIKEALPEIDKSELWSPEFLKLNKYDDRELLKALDIRHLAFNPDDAKSKALDRMAYLLSISDNIAPQDIKSPLPLIQALKDIGVVDLAKYQGEDLHHNHDLITDICRKAKSKQNIRRLGAKQGKKESNMQFVARLLEKMGLGTSKVRYEKQTKTRFYRIADKSRQQLERWQFDRGFRMLGLSVYSLPKEHFEKCLSKDDNSKNLAIPTLSEFFEVFGDLTPILQVAYRKAKNLNHLDLIHQQLNLIFESVDIAFEQIVNAINTRYQQYNQTKKVHDFERILDSKNNKAATPETVAEPSIDVDHPPKIIIKETEGEGDPVFAVGTMVKFRRSIGLFCQKKIYQIQEILFDRFTGKSLFCIDGFPICGDNLVCA